MRPNVAARYNVLGGGRRSCVALASAEPDKFVPARHACEVKMPFHLRIEGESDRPLLERQGGKGDAQGEGGIACLPRR